MAKPQGPPLPLRIHHPTKAELEARAYSKYSAPVQPGALEQGEIGCRIYHIHGTEDLRTTIKWKLDIEQMVRAKAITNLTTIQNLTKACCLGAPRQVYENSIAKSQATRNQNALSRIQDGPEREQGENVPNFNRRVAQYNRETEEMKNLTMEDHTRALQAVIQNRAPRNALADQEEAMRHSMQKPDNMDVRTYHNSLTYLNNVELPELPPFAGISQSLPDTALKQIIVHGVPHHWKTMMDRMAFQPNEHTLDELIYFMESQEASEGRSGKNNNHQSNKRQKRNGNGNPTGKWCTHHKVDTHNTEECNAKRYHKTNETSSGKFNGRSNGKNNNKNWQKKAADAKLVTMAEVNAIIQRNIKGLKEFKKEQQAKLRKAFEKEEANAVDLTHTDDNDTVMTNNSNQRKRKTQTDDDEVDQLIQAVNNDLYVTDLDAIMENEPVAHKQSEAENDAKNAEMVRKWLFSPKNSNHKPLAHAKVDQADVHEYPIPSGDTHLAHNPKNHKSDKYPFFTLMDEDFGDFKGKTQVSTGTKIRKNRKVKKICKVPIPLDVCMGLTLDTHKTAKTNPICTGIEDFFELGKTKCSVPVDVTMTEMTKNDSNTKITGNPKLANPDVLVNVTMTEMTQNDRKIKKSKKVNDLPLDTNSTRHCTKPADFEAETGPNGAEINTLSAAELQVNDSDMAEIDATLAE